MNQKIVLLLLVVALLTASIGAVYALGLPKDDSAALAEPTHPTTEPTDPATEATGQTTDPTEAPTDETKPIQSFRPSLGYLDGYASSKMPLDKSYYYETYGTSEKEQVVLDVPVYYEKDILFNSSLGFSVWWRNFMRRNSTYIPTFKKVFFGAPTNALRIREDGTAYAIWDTDTGYRLYVFYNPSREIFTGWPIVINKNKIPTLQDFQDIKIGDPLEKVSAIDGVAGLSEYMVVTSWEWTEEIWYNALDSFGSDYQGPLCSYHYCKDGGILRIEYEEDAALEGLNFVVSKITLYEDYVVDNYTYPVDWTGEDWTLLWDMMPRLNQKILDIDLPVQG